jgi:YbbR domain-containing protein
MRTEGQGSHRPWGVRVLALAIALPLWFALSVAKREELSEKMIEAAVSYSPPPGFILLDPVQRVQLRLRGRTSKIRSLNPFVVDVLVAVTDPRRGNHDVQLSAANVIVPDGIEVISVDPNALRVQLDEEARQMVPVEARLVGEPAAGAVAREPIITPARVLVSGPASRLRDLRSVSTTAINLDGHALNFAETAAVVTPDPLIKVVQPSVVTVEVPMEPPAGTAAGSAPEGSR